MQHDKGHIGNLIKMTLEDEGRSVKWLAKKIHCKRSNIYDIFNRASIDSAQLLRISLALKINFFMRFSKICDIEADTTEFASPMLCYIQPQDEMNIGALIKKRLEDEEHSVNMVGPKDSLQTKQYL